MGAFWAVGCSVAAAHGAGKAVQVRIQKHLGSTENIYLMMEQGQAVCLFKHVTFKCGNLSCRSLKPTPGFIIKADRGLHTVFVTALSLASQDIGGCQILGFFFFFFALIFQAAPGSWSVAVTHNQLLNVRNEVQSAPGKML